MGIKHPKEDKCPKSQMGKHRRRHLAFRKFNGVMGKDWRRTLPVPLQTQPSSSNHTRAQLPSTEHLPIKLFIWAWWHEHTDYKSFNSSLTQFEEAAIERPFPRTLKGHICIWPIRHEPVWIDRGRHHTSATRIHAQGPDRVWDAKNV